MLKQPTDHSWTVHWAATRQAEVLELTEYNAMSFGSSLRLETLSRDECCRETWQEAAHGRRDACDV